MDTDVLTAGLLQELRATRPYPALSLTMPTHRRAPDNAQDPVRLRNLLSEAHNRLEADPAVSRETCAAIKRQLERAVSELDQRRALDALVLLATADEYRIWRLPRTAPERVVLSDSYLTHNLVAAKAQARPFWALTVAADHAALFSGTTESAQEARIGGFPLTAPREEFNPQRMERTGDTPSNFANEDTKLFLRTVDEKLRAVLATDPRPLYLVGIAPALALFDEAGQCAKDAVGRVTKGAPADNAPRELLTELRPALDARRARFAAEIDARLDAARGRKAFAGGLDEVWAAVREGRAGLVAVEEHYQQTVRMDEEHLRPVTDEVVDPADVTIREDIVDELVEAALDSGAEVYFVADGSLEAHGRIAAELRF
ncbi:MULTISPECIES: baeRF3 domain-containing protein [unclassified Streptomyces]|uniref:baeRF3 domain-containing protein n=1 Tax=unclassified Streptomyces TaxID=2593676 RepID=UPI000DAE191F|nr:MULTISPECIES: chemotaxis protein [unclassified Streptomyces]PZT73487.1 chemotaxis protein [Streptomyces sp. AC1-42T]PZT83520.1 chemotaxis protein [Streptomyces sp. AC1-42W]